MVYDVSMTSYQCNNNTVSMSETGAILLNGNKNSRVKISHLILSCIEIKLIFPRLIPRSSVTNQHSYFYKMRQAPLNKMNSPKSISSQKSSSSCLIFIR